MTDSTDSLISVVIPYSRFVECQRRRQQVAAELMLLNPRRTIDAEVIPPGPTDRSVPQTVNDKQI
jgi:hypothetical protein